MDLPQLEDWADSKPQLKQSTLEKVRIFRWLVGSLFTLIAATFVLMLWVLGEPNSYQQHAAAAGPSSTWPDGSARTPEDSSWDKAGHQVAQPPAQPPQAQPPSRG
jgi:hypothetical protein